MKCTIFTPQTPPNTYDFISNDIAAYYRISNGEHITGYYFYSIEGKICAFSSLMYEGLTLGFMHYHIPLEKHAYFAEKYPELVKPTHQIHYLYTAEAHRKKGYASALFQYVVHDLIAQGFPYIWIRCQITPKFYFDKGFLTFTQALERICPNFETLKQDYETQIGEWALIDRHFGDLRMVYLGT